MRRLAIAAAGSLTLAGCGGSHSTQPTTHMALYFCTPISCPSHGFATASEISSVRSKVQTAPGVQSVSFIPRAAALKKLLKTYPQYKGTIPSDPLPSSLVIRTSDPRGLARSLHPLPPGVQTLRRQHRLGLSR